MENGLFGKKRETLLGKSTPFSAPNGWAIGNFLSLSLRQLVVLSVASYWSQWLG
jgi:hypothetical protein